MIISRQRHPCRPTMIQRSRHRGRLQRPESVCARTATRGGISKWTVHHVAAKPGQATGPAVPACPGIINEHQLSPRGGGLVELNPTAHHANHLQMDRLTAVAPGWPIPGVTAPFSQKVAAMVRVNPDPYLALGVSPTATQAEITHAYRDRLRAHHPDTRHTPSSQTADEHLRQVLAAYALLRDPARRADYDRATTRTTAPPAYRRQRPTPADSVVADCVQIPITHHATTATAAQVPPPPLRAGPVRRHQ